jgi:hypothetical protein
MSNSIGDLRNSGLQGNNFPWQLKMLQGLQAIYDEVKLPLTCVEDSISVCADGTPLTTSNDGGIDSLNVHITNTIPLEVNLTCDDSVSICSDNTPVGSGNPLPVSVTETKDSIQIYASDGGNNVPVLVGQQPCSDSLSVTLCTQQAQVQITPNIQVLSGVIGFLPDAVYSISFANVGTVPITLSFDGGTTPVTIPVGVTINMDAGGLGNQYPPSTFAWDTDFVGASLIITYNT